MKDQPSPANDPVITPEAVNGDPSPAAAPLDPFSIKETLPFMRQINDHRVVGSATDPCVALCTVDLPGAGGANHYYQIVGVDPVNNQPTFGCDIEFQNGPVAEKGINGVTNEALLAVVIDRLRGFQHPRNATPDDGRGHFLLEEAGQYACPENAAALAHCNEALGWLKKRTLRRMERGVEGTHKV